MLRACAEVNSLSYSFNTGYFQYQALNIADVDKRANYRLFQNTANLVQRQTDYSSKLCDRFIVNNKTWVYDLQAFQFNFSNVTSPA